MKKFLTLALCILLLFAAAVPASADVDFGWWKKETRTSTPLPPVHLSTPKPTATPAPTATAKTSASCSMCDGTGYTALKTGTGDYVAVPCPQCSNGGGTTATTTNKFEENVFAFVDYLKQRLADHDMEFVFTTRDTEYEEEFEELVANAGIPFQWVQYVSRDENYTLAFGSEDDNITVHSVHIDCANPEELETVVVSALIIIEAMGLIDDNVIDWVWDSADKLVTDTKRGEKEYTLDIKDNNILVHRTYEFGDKTKYDYSIVIR